MNKLQWITGLTLFSVPDLKNIRADLSWHNWSSDVHELAQRSDLAPFKRVLQDIATDSLKDEAGVNDFLNNNAPGLQLGDFYAAAAVIESEMERRPHACLPLSYICLLAWIAREGDHLYRVHPHSAAQSGWDRFPYLFAKNSAALGAHWGALRVIEHAITGLLAIPARWEWIWQLPPRLAKYQLLAIDVQQQFEHTIGELAEDIRDVMHEHGCVTRACIAAACWTLGLVPEAFTIRDNPKYIPSRRFLKSLLLESFSVIDRNPFIQHVLLALKQVTDFDIRAHRSLFSVLNMRFMSCALDEIFHKTYLSPSTIYADVLVNVFSGKRLSVEIQSQFAASYNFAIKEGFTRKHEAGLLALMTGAAALIDDRIAENEKMTGIAFNGGIVPTWSKDSRCMNWFVSHLYQRMSAASITNDDIRHAVEIAEQINRSSLRVFLASSDPFVLLRELDQPELERDRDGITEFLRGAYLLSCAGQFGLFGGLLHTGPKSREPLYRDDVSPENAEAVVGALLNKLDNIYLGFMQNFAYGTAQVMPGTPITIVAAALSQHIVKDWILQ